MSRYQTVETIGHVSGHCPSVKKYRIKRHNVIAYVLAEKSKQLDWLVSTEPKIKDAEHRVWKPDLIMVKESRAVVIDPTVVFENGNTLL